MLVVDVLPEPDGAEVEGQRTGFGADVRKAGGAVLVVEAGVVRSKEAEARLGAAEAEEVEKAMPQTRSNFVEVFDLIK